MSKPEVVYIGIDDWEAWYIDGECVGQTHRVISEDLMRELAKRESISFNEVFEDPAIEEYLQNGTGRFPDKLHELEEVTGEQYRPE